MGNLSPFDNWRIEMQILYEFILKYLGFRAINRGKEISGVRAIIAGFNLAILATVPVHILLQALFSVVVTIFGIDDQYFETNWLLLAGALLISQSYFLVGGLVKIRIVYCSVPLFFGKRPEEDKDDKEGKIPVLNEGYSWTLPWPFMSSEEVDLKPNTFELEKPMEVLSGGTSAVNMGDTTTQVTDEASKSERVAFLIQAGILYRVNKKKLNRHLEAKANFAELLLVVIRSVIREESAKMNDENLLSLGYQAIADVLTKKLTEPEKDADGKPVVTGKDHDGKDVLAVAIADRLGIQVIKGLVTKIVPADPNMIRNYERIKKEQLDRRAETVEADNFIALVNKVRNGLGRNEVSAAEAADYIQAERGKARRVIIKGGVPGDFATAEALRQSSEQPKS